MSLLVATSLLLSSAAFTPPQPMPRRAVLSAAAAAAFSSSHVLPAAATSKKKAAEKALQKSTAKEAREAMKEYKTAPRPELLGNAETGYSYKAGTVKAGSQGELASYFNDKGAKIQADYAKDQARNSGKSSAEADRVAKEKLEKIQAERAAKLAAKKKEGFDEIAIKQFCKENPNALDQLGRPQCK